MHRINISGIVVLTITSVIMFMFSGNLFAQSNNPSNNAQPDGPRITAPKGAHHTEVPDHLFDIILGRPTDESVTLRILAYKNLESYFVYGSQEGTYTRQTNIHHFQKDEPLNIVFDSLRPDTRYYYQMLYQESGSDVFTEGEEYTFHTQRAPGKGFTFTIIADSHLDANTRPELYKTTLKNALADNPDFHVDLGDTFMNRRTKSKLYLTQRYYLGLLCHSAPLFLTLGNHDDRRGSPAVNLRKKYYPNPVPDGFYTGNDVEEPGIGYPENYYAWEWGDALIIALDPYWFSKRERRTRRGSDDNRERSDNRTSGKAAPAGGDTRQNRERGNSDRQAGDDNRSARGGKGESSNSNSDSDSSATDFHWGITLGERQYQWFKKTLEESNAKFRFVFIHNLVGGVSTRGGNTRGGAEAAKYWEWGGYNADNTYGFPQQRPQWDMPIHQLMVRNKVDVLFHGHDHLFTKQDLDGIVYQLVPQPAMPMYDGIGSAAVYGYKQGVIIGPAGHLRVTVSEKEAVVDYIRAYLPEHVDEKRVNGENAYSYTITAD